MRDLKIVNARIPDYERDCLREVDLLIRDGKIEKIRKKYCRFSAEFTQNQGVSVVDTQDIGVDERGKIGYNDTCNFLLHFYLICNLQRRNR